MKRLIFFFATFALLLFFYGQAVAGESDYCSIPPYLANSVAPNVLLVQDISGSMAFSAYNPDDKDQGYCNDDLKGKCPSSYNPSATYNGYFIPTDTYSYDSTNNFWYIDNGATAQSCPSSLFTSNSNSWWNSINITINSNDSYSGNCLNFLVMSRNDLIKWSMTGGEPLQCAQNGHYSSNLCDPNDINSQSSLETTADGYTGIVLEPSFSNPNEYENVLSNFLGNVPSSYRTPLSYGFNFDVLAPLSQFQNSILESLSNSAVKPRIGLELFTSTQSGNRPYVLSYKVYIGDYPTDSSGTIENGSATLPYTYVIRYLNYAMPLGGTPTGPALWDAMAYFSQINAPYSDGFNTGIGTMNDPLYVCNYEGQDCQSAPCAKNFIILMSDGGWNEPSCDNNYSSLSPDPVQPAYLMHIGNASAINGPSSSLRSDFSGIHINDIYTLYLGNLGATTESSQYGNNFGQQAMENIAMYGSFSYNPNTQIYPGSLVGYPNSSCTDQTDCSASDNNAQAQGSLCTSLPTCTSDWCNSQTGLPNNFYNVSNADGIKNSITSDMNNIIEQASSGTSVSTTSNQETQQGSTLVQALFYPQKTFDDNTYADWIGYLYNWWLYEPLSGASTLIQEDQGSPNILNTSSDYTLNFIISASGQLMAQEYNANNDLVNTVPIDQLSPIWEAGKILWSTNISQRTIYTDNGLTLVAFTDNNENDFVDNFGNLNEDYLMNGNTNATTNDEANNLINYISGEDLTGARNRTVNINGTSNVWKLGDIINSTPVIWQYTNWANPSGSYSVVYVGANDGMLHAFLLGNVQKTGLTSGNISQICDNGSSTCSTSEIGHELWAYIPQESLPYLKYLADPNYCHLYYQDLSPYIFRADGHVILIGGMRLGGATGCTASGSVNPPSDANGMGYSSYYALDVTNPTQPIFLWDWTNPALGFSYSGPALIDINGNYSVMFLSGPTDYYGDSGQPITAFILSLNKDFKINGNPYPYSFGNSLGNSFGGRLFTQGITDPNGNTIAVSFGVTLQHGSIWSGAVFLMFTNNSSIPSNWKFDEIDTTKNPITSKVGHGSCFGQTYLYFGTGKYFLNNPQSDSNDYNKNTPDKLYGVNITNCLSGDNCNIDASESSNNSCGELTSNGNGLPSWKVDLDLGVNGYLKERDISNPTVTGQNAVFFSTTEPTNSLCGFGGRTRVWALNCATGQSALSTSCGGFVNTQISGSVYLQTSTGQLTQINPNTITPNANNHPVSAWQNGVAPESSPPFISGFSGRTGVIIQWLEQ